MIKAEKDRIYHSEPKVGVIYFSVCCGHRSWRFTGKTNFTVSPLHPEPTYEFEDVCGVTEDVTPAEFRKYFWVR